MSLSKFIVKFPTHITYMALTSIAGEPCEASLTDTSSIAAACSIVGTQVITQRTWLILSECKRRMQ